MKQLWFAFFTVGFFAFAQTPNYCSFYNKIDTENYQFDFKLDLSGQKNIQSVLDSLVSVGFYTLKLDTIQNNPTTCNVYYQKGDQYQTIWVENSAELKPYLGKIQSEQNYFPVNNLDSLIQNINYQLIESGRPFSAVTINPKGFTAGKAFVELILEKDKQRTINGIKVLGYNKISKGFLHQIMRQNKDKIYNETWVNTLTENINNSLFVSEQRPAQVLFTPDSTLLYLYINKVKSNSFDGILGFGNSSGGNFKVTGDVNLQLNNNFNGMESIGLSWKSSEDESQDLKMNVEVPYIFKGFIGSKTQLNIFKSDSTYVNLNLAENIYYNLNQKSKIGVNLNLESSNYFVTSEIDSSQYNDYTKTGIGLLFEYSNPTPSLLTPFTDRFYLQANSVKRKNEADDNNSQYSLGLWWARLQKIHNKHFAFLKLESEALFSKNDSYYTNELYRFGGFGSIRGFNQQSIYANAYAIGTIEYRYIPSNEFYASLFCDYGWLDNQLNSQSDQLMGIGTGFAFLTKLGVFKISYAIGKFSNSSFDFNNGKIHFGLAARF